MVINRNNLFLRISRGYFLTLIKGGGYKEMADKYYSAFDDNIPDRIMVKFSWKKPEVS